MLEQIAVVLFLAYFTEIVVEHLVGKPLEELLPNLGRWALIYVALAVGAAIGWFAEVNLFTGLFANVLLGRIMTAAIIGGGSEVVHLIITALQDLLGKLQSR